MEITAAIENIAAARGFTSKRNPLDIRNLPTKFSSYATAELIQRTTLLTAAGAIVSAKWLPRFNVPGGLDAVAIEPQAQPPD